jgi:hypothetical protein
LELKQIEKRKIGEERERWKRKGGGYFYFLRKLV